MSFLNGARVSPSTNTSVETELSVSLVREKDKNHFNNKEGKESANIDDYGANEYQEGLDGIPEQQLHNASSLFQNGKKNRPGSHCPKRLSWEPEGGSLSNKRSRYHTSDQVILISLCLLSAASVLLTLLMLFGVLEPRNCACANKTESDTSTAGTEYAQLSKNMQELKENVSSLKEGSSVTAYKNVSQELQKVTTELEEVKKKYIQLKTEITDVKGKNISSDTSQENTTALWQAIKTYRQELMQQVIQLEKDNITAIWRAIKIDRQEIMQLDLKVVNISKVQGPRGPPGYNGTQGPLGVPGPPGYNGTQGPPGGSGSGGLSLCSYKETKSPTISAGSYARSEVTATETNGKKFVGVNCGTNDAKVFTLSSTDAGGKRTYKCQCKDTLSSGASNMYCIIHYWECPA